MRGRGFTSHPLMGAVVLCGAWVAIYLRHIIPAIRAGGVSEAIAIAAGVIGAIAAPALLIITEGDEGLGILGIIAALLAGWVSARISMVLEASPAAIESARLSGAALGPIVVYGGFSVAAWAVGRRKSNPSISSRDKARVYILGAGASRFGGYPLAPKLWPFVRDRSPGDVVANQRLQAVIKEMERIIIRFPPKVYDEPDLEELFTFLDLSLLIPDVFQLEHANWQSMRPQMVGMIADAFMNYQHDLQGYLYSGGKAPQGVTVDRETTVKVLDAWATKIVEGDVLISFNWDLFHDVTLHRAGKWLHGDGYGFKSQQAAVARSSPVKLYKLHGSVNWAQTETDEEPAILYNAVFFGDPRDDENYMKEVGWDQGRKSMIIPSYLKSVGPNPTLVRIWNKAGEALRSAEEVVVIGYGLHRADSLAHHLFMSSLLDNPHRPSVEIVAPAGSPDNWDDLCFALGLTRKRTRTNFEDWVLEAGTSPRRTR